MSDTDEAIELYFMVPDEKFLNVGFAFDKGSGSFETGKAARYTCEFIRMTSMMGERAGIAKEMRGYDSQWK
jgi:hypothetical protein